MLKFCSLYSGSSGNCSLVQSNNANILIDAGESAKKIVNALSFYNINISDINAILVSHEHIDHVKSIGTISSRYNIPIFANKETWNAMPDQSAKINDCNKKFFITDDDFKINDLSIHPFSIPHDAANPCGFSIYLDNKKISIATDFGHVTYDVLKNLENSSFALLEANYDSNILKCSRYPYILKRRISGPNGHLSNSDTGILISKLINSGLSSVMLGHLSKENNFPELAYKTVVEEIIKNKCNENSILINVAKRDQPSKFINIA